MTTNISSLSELLKFAAKFSTQLKSGQIIALQGPLGAGKTSFVKSLVNCLNPQVDVTSPTFQIIHIYPWKNNKKIVHVDLYRLKDKNQLMNLGIEQYLTDPNNLVLIEWPELILELLRTNTIYFTFEIINDTTRRISIN